MDSSRQSQIKKIRMIFKLHLRSGNTLTGSPHNSCQAIKDMSIVYKEVFFFFLSVSFNMLIKYIMYKHYLNNSLAQSGLFYKKKVEVCTWSKYISAQSY
jgi:hypothetical protein